MSQSTQVDWGRGFWPTYANQLGLNGRGQGEMTCEQTHIARERTIETREWVWVGALRGRGGRGGRGSSSISCRKSGTAVFKAKKTFANQEKLTYSLGDYRRLLQYWKLPYIIFLTVHYFHKLNSIRENNPWIFSATGHLNIIKDMVSGLWRSSNTSRNRRT